MARRMAADSTVGSRARSEARILGEVLHWWQDTKKRYCPPDWGWKNVRYASLSWEVLVAKRRLVCQEGVKSVFLYG